MIATIAATVLACAPPPPAPPAPAEDAAASIRALTFNIRYHNPADGPHAWPNRRDRVVALIESFDADIIALQEALPAQLDFIAAALGDAYTIRGVGRNDGANNPTSGEASPILFRADRFEEIDRGTWWLSETPDVPGSKGWDAAITRIATWVRLVPRLSEPGGFPSRRLGVPEEFLIICTHFDHVGEIARLKSAELLREKLREEPRVILLGDFNAEPGSEPHRTLTAPQGEKPPAFIDAAGEDELPTWCGWDGQPDEGRRIDWILLRGFEAVAYEVPKWKDPSRPESDHLPVFAEVRSAPPRHPPAARAFGLWPPITLPLSYNSHHAPLDTPHPALPDPRRDHDFRCGVGMCVLCGRLVKPSVGWFRVANTWSHFERSIAGFLFSARESWMH